jgi:hypothetical protein
MYETRRRINVTQEEGCSLCRHRHGSRCDPQKNADRGRAGRRTDERRMAEPSPSSEAGVLVHEVGCSERRDPARRWSACAKWQGSVGDGRALRQPLHRSSAPKSSSPAAFPCCRDAQGRRDVGRHAMAKDDKTAYVALGHAAHVAVDAATRKVLGYILCRQKGSPSRATRRRSMSPTALVVTCRSQGEVAVPVGRVCREGTPTNALFVWYRSALPPASVRSSGIARANSLRDIL